MSRQPRKKPPHRSGQHREWRTKVTLANFYAKRLNAPGVIPDEGIAAARLLGSPVDSPLLQTRDYVRQNDKALARKARSFLTLGAIYAQRETFARKRAEPYKWSTWLASFMSPADVREMLARRKTEGKS